MLLPLGTDRPRRRGMPVTMTLIVLNVLAYTGQMLVLSQGGEQALRELIGALAIAREPLHWWAFVTSAFLHAPSDPLHLAGNMLFLWVFGPNVEDRFGHLWFAAFYLAGAVLSGLVHILFEAAPAIGASGAIAAVTGAYLCLFPRTYIRCLLFFFLITFLMVPAWVFVLLRVGMDLFLAGGSTGVAHWAHLGGYASGFGISYVLLATGVLSREPYDIFSLGKQAGRRRQLREAAAMSGQREAAVRRGAGEGGRGGRAVAKLDPASERIAELRADVSRAVAEERLDEAAEAYGRLESAYPDRREATTLSRGVQFAVASHLYRLERWEEAAAAYERFLAAYPSDRDADTARLLLARAYAHALDRPGDARSLLEKILQSPASDELQGLAREELAALPRGG